MGRADFFGLCPYLRYTEVVRYVNKTCPKQAGFTDCAQLEIFQNRFSAGNDDPKPADDWSILQNSNIPCLKRDVIRQLDLQKILGAF